MTADEKARVDAVPTQNLEAWEAYQIGKQRMARRTSHALAEAERSFREALELDPKFELAHAGLADTPIDQSPCPRLLALSQLAGDDRQHPGRESESHVRLADLDVAHVG